MSFIKEMLAQLSEQHLRRTLTQHDDQPGRMITIEGKQVLNFSSNNYLGLALHPRLIEAARDALGGGTGSTASRLVTGNLALHEKLETGLAKLHGVSGARLFNSGYQANLGLISSLAGPEDLIVSDQLNHASVIDGCRLSRARVLVADHADLASFRRLLATSEACRRRFVVTDSVFSMDGDLAPLVALRELCDEQDAMLIVDEAHAVGALGPNGAGICAALGVEADALVGGFGKAFGSYGGYVAGSSELCEYLLNRARSFVFSTALPPAVAAASLEALHLLTGEEGNSKRATLDQRITQLRNGLDDLNLLEAGAGQSSIFPIIAGKAETAIRASDSLRRAGVFCQAIRPPTVAQGRSRLRIALSALHTEADVDRLLTGLAELQLG
jgi:8-amino-7-oxononanoate synthase